MSKKEKIPSTPEMRAQKLARSAEKRKIFGKTFEKAFGIMLALLLVYSVCSIAFKPATATVAPSAGTQTSSGSSSGSSSSGSSSSGSSSSGSASSSASSDMPLLLLRTILRLLRAMPQLPQSFPHQAR